MISDEEAKIAFEEFKALPNWIKRLWDIDSFSARKAEQLQAENREFAEMIVETTVCPSCLALDDENHAIDCKYLATIQKAKERCK